MRLLDAPKPLQIEVGRLLRIAEHNLGAARPLLDRVQVGVLCGVGVHLVRIVVGGQIGEIVLGGPVEERPVHVLSAWIEGDVVAVLVLELDALGVWHRIGAGDRLHLAEWVAVGARLDGVLAVVGRGDASPESGVFVRCVDGPLAAAFDRATAGNIVKRVNDVFFRYYRWNG